MKYTAILLWLVFANATEPAKSVLASTGASQAQQQPNTEPQTHASTGFRSLELQRIAQAMRRARPDASKPAQDEIRFESAIQSLSGLPEMEGDPLSSIELEELGRLADLVHDDGHASIVAIAVHAQLAGGPMLPREMLAPSAAPRSLSLLRAAHFVLAGYPEHITAQELDQAEARILSAFPTEFVTIRSITNRGKQVLEQAQRHATLSDQKQAIRELVAFALLPAPVTHLGHGDAVCGYAPLRTWALRRLRSLKPSDQTTCIQAFVELREALGRQESEDLITEVAEHLPRSLRESVLVALARP